MPGPFLLAPFVGIGRAAGADIGMQMKEFLDKAGKEPASGAPPTVEELLALERVRRKRLCPDRSKLLAGGVAVQRHLEYCETCRERLDSASRKLKFTGLPKLAVHKETAPEAGQVRDVRKTASGMVDVSSDEWLFNPPMVLVIQTPDAGKLFVRVAQMHDESELAGPGDIPVQMPDGVFFIESWNTYPMLSKHLGPVLGTVDPEIVKLVIRNEKKELPAVAEDSPIESFRELETRISYFFCRDSVHQILAGLNEKESRKKGKAKIIPFIPPTYDGERDHWNETQVSVNYCREEKASAGFLFPFPIVACVASVAGAVGGLWGKEDDNNEETKDKIKEILAPLNKYVKDASHFREMADTLYSEYRKGILSKTEVVDKADFLLINAEKAANAVLYFASDIAEKANSGEIKGDILPMALGLVKNAREEVAKIEGYLDLLGDEK